jgi:transcriptional regulator with XRE-family HTH domain
MVAIVAQNIRAFRERKGLSLSELAARAGLGKSTLSNLEATKANPSIETLWAIAAALGLPVGQLIEPQTPDVQIVRAGQGVRIYSESAPLHARLLDSSTRRGTFELYMIETEPGAVHEAKAHIPGTVEHIFVLSGRLKAGPAGAEVELKTGDLARFRGDVDHRYEALKPKSKALMLMDYG